MSPSQIYSERFLNQVERLNAVIELSKMGRDALPILEEILSGSAKNRFGIEYRKLGMPLECSFHVMERLGIEALPLEKYILNELEQKRPYAVAERINEVFSKTNT